MRQGELNIPVLGQQGHENDALKNLLKDKNNIFEIESITEDENITPENISFKITFHKVNLVPILKNSY